MKKIARSAASARTVEGLIGAVLGGGAGAAGSALFYEPTNPREWVDEHGVVRDRPLTLEEKRTRNQLISAVALAGALGGGGLALGGSRYLAKRVATAERKAAKELADDYLLPLRHNIDDYKAEYAKSVDRSGKGSIHSKRWKKRVNVAKQMLKKERGKVNKLLDTADKRRSQVPFRGYFRPEGGKGSGYDYSKMTHPGLVERHFTRFAKRQGYPAMNKMPDGKENPSAAFEVFDSAVTSKMTKVSYASMMNELEKIAKQPRYVRDVIEGVIPMPKGHTGDVISQRAGRVEYGRGKGRRYKKPFSQEHKTKSWERHWNEEAGEKVLARPKSLWQKVAPSWAPGGVKTVQRKTYAGKPLPSMGDIGEDLTAGMASKKTIDSALSTKRQRRIKALREKMNIRSEGPVGSAAQSASMKKGIRHRYKYGPKAGQPLPGTKVLRKTKPAPLPEGITDRSAWNRAMKEVEEASLKSRMARVARHARQREAVRQRVRV